MFYFRESEEQRQREKDRKREALICCSIISTKKDIKTINKNQLEIKNTLESINSRLDEAENRISNSDDKKTENIQAEKQKEKRGDRAFSRDQGVQPAGAGWRDGQRAMDRFTPEAMPGPSTVFWMAW